MTLLVSVFKCFLVAVIVGSAVGDREGGATSATADDACPQEVREQDHLPLYHNVVISKIITCVNTLVGDSSALKSNKLTDEAIQSYFNTMCLGVPSFSSCLVAIRNTLHDCSDRTYLSTFFIFSNILGNTVRAGCFEDGKLFSTLMQEFFAIEESSPAYGQIRVCGLKSATIVKALHKTNVDIYSKLFIQHEEYGKFVGCISEIQLDQSLKESFDIIKNKIWSAMMCIHPQYGTIELCQSVGSELVSAPSLCEAKTQGSKLDLYDVLENDVGRCFEDIVLLDIHRPNRTNDNETLQLHEDIKEFCEKHGQPLFCIDETKQISEICLNASENSEFARFLSIARKGLGDACLEDGRRLADVLFEVYRLNGTGQGHAVWDCVNVVKSTRHVSDEHRSSSKNMRFYHELEAFKGCLVNKLQGHQTSVDAATSLIDEVLKKVECPGVEDGSTVTCESLMNHQNH